MLVERLAKQLTQRQWHLAIAESATGGLLGHQITAVAGSSAYFWGGVIAYANDVKMKLLGVSEESLSRWGAVSAEVASEMAKGARLLMGTEVGLSVTGIAGPTGATAQKPLGLYYIGLAVPGEAWSWRHHFTGDRHENNHRAAQMALEHLLAYLEG